MRKLWVCLAMLFLIGCSKDAAEIDRGMALREKLLNCDSCTFEAEITADFGDKTYTFTLDCQGKGDGSLSFLVQKPDSISGIGGVLSATGGKITFEEDRAVAFPMLAEGELTPVSGPWILYNTLRSGFLFAGGMEGEWLRLTLNDSYEEEALQVDVWLDDEDRPMMAEIFWQGRRVLSLQVRNFQIL